MRRGVTRRTTHVVFGRALLAKAAITKAGDAEIERRVNAERAAGRALISENGFLRLLGLMKAPEASSLSRQSLIDQSRLSGADLDLLSLFDAFEHDGEPYSFRDLILARKYAGLVSPAARPGARSRARCTAPARSPRSPPSRSMSARSTGGPDAIYLEGRPERARRPAAVRSRQPPATTRWRSFLPRLKAAEEEGRHDDAAALYQRCLAIDPSDAIAAFNRANCLRGAGRTAEAAHDYARAIKLDPGFVEAWFNLAGLMSDEGKIASARRHLVKAIALDKSYADPVFNLARLEFDAGNLAEARRNWVRYLELDADSEWARMAAKGIQFVDLQLARTAG